MKILYHHRTLGDGAEGVHIKEMVNAFRQLGHNVKVVGPTGEPAETAQKDSKINFFSEIRTRMPRFSYELLEVAYNFWGFFLLSKEIYAYHPDFIYDRYMIFNASSILVGKKFKIPVFLEVNAPLALERYKQPDEKLYLKGLAFSLERWISANSYRTIVVSTPLKDYLVSIGVPSKKMIVMPNGVNLEKFQPKVGNSKKLLKKCGFCEDDIIVGFVGILRPWHGVELLLEAFSQATRRINNLRLLIVGDGPIRFEIEQKIKTLNIDNKVYVTGRLPHKVVPSYANLFDIAVSPKTTFYASPMKIVEYMALGKAVVAPDTRNIRDLLGNSNCGVLFRPGSSRSLARILVHLACNREMRMHLGEKALERVRNRLNWIQNAKKIEQEYCMYRKNTLCKS